MLMPVRNARHCLVQWGSQGQGRPMHKQHYVPSESPMPAACGELRGPLHGCIWRPYAHAVTPKAPSCRQPQLLQRRPLPPACCLTSCAASRGRQLPPWTLMLHVSLSLSSEGGGLATARPPRCPARPDLAGRVGARPPLRRACMHMHASCACGGPLHGWAPNALRGTCGCTPPSGRPPAGRRQVQLLHGLPKLPVLLSLFDKRHMHVCAPPPHTVRGRKTLEHLLPPPCQGKCPCHKPNSVHFVQGTPCCFSSTHCFSIKQNYEHWTVRVCMQQRALRACHAMCSAQGL